MTGADVGSQQLLFASNKILAAVPPGLRAELLEAAERVDMPKRSILFQQGDVTDRLIFPIETTVLGLSISLADRAVPVALLDSYHAAGTSSPGAPYPVTATATVLLSGPALVVPHVLIGSMIRRSREVSDAIARANDALLAQLMQGTACHLRHGLEARLADRLYALHLLGGQCEIAMTHNELADLLVAQRTSITAAATALQQRGLIDYRRGQIVVRNADGLAITGCGCWKAVAAHRRRLFGC